MTYEDGDLIDTVVTDAILACDVEGCTQIGAWCAERAEERLVLCREHFANVSAAGAVQRAGREILLAVAQLPLSAATSEATWLWDANGAAFPDADEEEDGDAS